MTTKVCRSCHEDKDLNCFGNYSRNTDGKRNVCKQCRSLESIKYRDRIKKYNKRYRLENKERLKEYDHTYYITHIDHKREVNRSRYIKNAVRNREYAKNYYHKNKLLISENWKKYYNKNKERLKLSKRLYMSTEYGRLLNIIYINNRRKKEIKHKNTLQLEQWNKILDLQGNKCAICGRRFSSRLKPTKDHIIPLSRGGGLTFENVQALCQSCNSRKSAHLDLNNIVSWGIYDDNTA